MSAPRPNVVNLERVHKSYGVRPLLDGVSLGVAAGQRVGVVGRNGDGKTTLLKIIGDREEPDQGRVSRSRGLHLGYLRQADDFPPGTTVGEAVLGERADPRVVVPALGAESDWCRHRRVRGEAGAAMSSSKRGSGVGERPASDRGTGQPRVADPRSPLADPEHIDSIRVEITSPGLSTTTQAVQGATVTTQPPAAPSSPRP